MHADSSVDCRVWIGWRRARFRGRDESPGYWQSRSVRNDLTMMARAATGCKARDPRPGGIGMTRGPGRVEPGFPARAASATAGPWLSHQTFVSIGSGT
ncbi:MAG: hypothetical protein ACYC61_26580 [Isosphaeraceae bacterium]